MAHGEHEAIAVGPNRVFRVKPKMALPEAVDHGRHGHRRSGVTGVGSLDGVHGQCADGVNALELETHLIVHGDSSWSVVRRPSSVVRCPLLTPGGNGQRTTDHGLMPIRFGPTPGPPP